MLYELSRLFSCFSFCLQCQELINMYLRKFIQNTTWDQCCWVFFPYNINVREERKLLLSKFSEQSNAKYRHCHTPLPLSCWLKKTLVDSAMKYIAENFCYRTLVVCDKIKVSKEVGLKQMTKKKTSKCCRHVHLFTVYPTPTHPVPSGQSSTTFHHFFFCDESVLFIGIASLL